MVVVVAALLFAGAALIGFQSAAVRADAARGSRLHSDLHFGAAGFDGRLHRQPRCARSSRSPTPLLKSGVATNIFSIARGSGSGGFMFLTLAPWDQRSRDAGRDHLRAQPPASASAGRSGLRPHVQQPRHPRRRAGPAVRPHRHRLRPAVRRRRQARPGDGEGPGLRPRPGQLRHDPAAALHQDRPRARRRRRHSRRRHFGRRPDAARAARTSATSTSATTRSTSCAKVPDGMIQDASALDNIQLRTRDGKMVPLSSLVSFAGVRRRAEPAAAGSAARGSDGRDARPMASTCARR